ncbi:MAG: GDP-mannose 4,6-dehydratase, partial [Flavobacteriales bacterium]
SPIKQFGDGGTGRDYTYVEDIVRGICSALERPLEAKEGAGAFDIFNLGNSRVVLLRDLIAAIEEETGRKAIIELHDEQPGDVPHTCASVAKSKRYLGYEPTVDLETGLRRFHEWYMSLTVPQQ